MSNKTDNNTAEMNGNSEVPATLLGPVFMLPKAGVIRPGIKILKKGCSDEDNEIYNKMLTAGATWNEIDRKLGTDDKGKSKLIPSNADYFTIRPEDCKNPDDAKQLHDLYADGDGKVRSLPVWFSVNEWHNIIPHGLRAFGRQRLLYHSDFNETRDHNNRVTAVTRVCKFPLTIEPGTRVYGGKKYGEKPCDPNNCREYQSGICTFGGVIRCHIPGVKGIGAWLIPTTSWYSLSQIKSTLEIVSGLTGGKISGLVEPSTESHGKFNTVFRLRKVADTVSMINRQSGDSQRVEQDLIHLDVDIDLTELAARFNSQSRISNGLESMRLLNAFPGSVDTVCSSDTSRQAEGIALEVPVVKEETDDNGASPSGPPKKEASSSSDNGANPEQKKEVSPNAKKLFDMIADKYNKEEDIKAKLQELTGKSSFFDIDDEEAKTAIDKLQGKTTSEEEPEEVKQLRQILTSFRNGDNNKVLEKLKEFTGVDSFAKVTADMAIKAMEKLAASAIETF